MASEESLFRRLAQFCASEVLLHDRVPGFQRKSPFRIVPGCDIVHNPMENSRTLKS